jgi:threonine dehydratase
MALGRGGAGVSLWPIDADDVRAAQKRLAPHLPPTALRRYAALDAAVGSGITVLVKHENHQPTNSFKVRNGLAALTALDEGTRRRGVVAATRGNHGQGVAWAGQLLGAPVTICVPRGNNPEKNEAMRGFGATLIEEGKDYDEAVEVAKRLVRERGLRLVHSTNEREVIAGAGTVTLEIVEAAPRLDAMVVAVGGGSLAVGALTVLRALRPGVAVYGVQAAGAPAIHDAWHGRPRPDPGVPDTFADGLATRSTYDLTFPALRAGLADFLALEDARFAEALRLLLRTTHNLVEGAGAAGLAGLLALRPQLAGQTVAIVLTGANIDAETLRRVITHAL